MGGVVASSGGTAELGFSLGGGGEDSAALSVSRRERIKLSTPNGSIGQKISFFKNFLENTQKNEPFLIALIENLIYNRIGVSIAS